MAAIEGTEHAPAARTSAVHPERRAVRFDPHLMDADALFVVHRLREAGFTAFLVGGCVRDLLTGMVPKDFDVSTDARPRQVRRVFRNARIIGRRFRLVHVVFGQRVIETSTFRRNPREDEAPAADADILLTEDNVFGTAAEDAARRDFTINGLFYDPEAGEVIDYVEGLADIERRVLRTIDDPWLRFREDPVRMMRAAKFAARLRFNIEPDTWQAMHDLRAEIQKSSPARVLEEMYKIGRGGASAGTYATLRQTGLLAELLPEVAAALDGDPLGADRFAARLKQLDGAKAARDEHGNCLLLAPLFHAVLAPLLREEPLDERTLPERCDERVRTITTRFRIARMDHGWARLMCWAQRRFLGWGRVEFPAKLFARWDCFDAALDYLRLRARCGEVPEDLPARWDARAAAEADKPRIMTCLPPRRRRGGRGRRG